MMKYLFDDEKISSHFSSEQVKHYMKENNFTELESLLYLWGFNNFSTNTDEVTTDLGRPMYRKLAKKLAKLLENNNE